MIPRSLVRDADGVLTTAAQIDVSYPETGASAMLAVEDSSFWFRHRNEVIAMTLDRFAPGAEVWDIGGGNGYQAKALQDRGREVVLVEPGAVGCRNAARRGVKNVIRASLEQLELPDASLHAITLLDVVEHLPDPVATLAECRRVLHPDGRVVITVPAFEVLWSAEDDYAEHQRRYTVALLRTHLESAGLRLEWSTFFFGALLVPIFLLRALPYKLRPARKEKAEPNLSEHQPGGVAQKVVDRLLARELEQLRAGRSKSIGSSILAVAALR